MPEVALEVLAILQRFIVATPLTTRPNREDFLWKWQRRPQPLRELISTLSLGNASGCTRP